MARSTLARVAGRTRSGELSTRETVWWETPARAATSDITGALSLLTSAWLPHTRYGRGTESSARSPRRARTTERSRCRGVCAPTATRADGQVAAAGAPPFGQPTGRPASQVTGGSQSSERVDWVRMLALTSTVQVLASTLAGSSPPATDTSGVE